MNVYSQSVVDETDITNPDYLTGGTTAFSTTINYGAYNVTGYNAFILDSNGRDNINLADTSFFSLKNAYYDVGANTPIWGSNEASYLYWYATEQGASEKPKLTITYTAGPDATIGDIDGADIGVMGDINGTDIGKIGDI